MDPDQVNDWFDELETQLGLSSDFLGKEINREDIRAIHGCLVYERDLAIELKLPDPKISAVEKDAGSQEERSLLLLQKWKEIFSFKAKRWVLVKALIATNKLNTARKVCERLMKQSGKYIDHFSYLILEAAGVLMLNTCCLNAIKNCLLFVYNSCINIMELVQGQILIFVYCLTIGLPIPQNVGTNSTRERCALPRTMVSSDNLNGGSNTIVDPGLYILLVVCSILLCGIVFLTIVVEHS